MKSAELFRNWGTFKKGMDVKSIHLAFASHLEYSLSKDQYTATPRDLYHALSLAVRDRLIERWIRTQQMYYHNDVKRIYYLSAEYLMGRALLNNLINLGMYENASKAMNAINMNVEEIAEVEPDAGLGNGGLGRLAACFLDSMATLELPAYGYGIRYEFGIFDQTIRNRAQFEIPDSWLKWGNPWELARPEYAFTVRFYGRVEEKMGHDGQYRAEWVDTHDVFGIAYDTPVCAYGSKTVNTLRLWAARATKEFDLDYFQDGDYLKAVEQKNISENISKVLYPNDNVFEGKELRLKQQYFLVSCSVQDIVRRFLVNHKTFDNFADKVAIQMNDTHPSLAVPELMRILLDDHKLSWEQAWDITVKTCAYTNHTLLSEALEKWPVDMFGRILPRHLKIIYEINRRFLRDVSVRHVGDNDRLRRLSIVEEEGGQRIRMAHLAIVGSHSVNGVSALHTRLLREQELRDFDEFFPGKFNNKTNGITPRRWLKASNTGLSELITKRIGDGWVRNLAELRGLEKMAGEAKFRQEFAAVKRANKERLAKIARDLTGVPVDPASLFDVQVKRIHEYKRQTLNILHVISLWLRLKQDRNLDLVPRTFFFGGKSAPGYYQAKLTIRLICHVADIVNSDPETRGLIRVVFLPNYRVSLAEKIFPASDLSEQISTAGFEASGTGNMKFMLNGALTIGTLDGANVEMREEVGDENIFIFGMTAEDVMRLRSNYRPWEFAERSPLLKQVLKLLQEGYFCADDPGLFKPIAESLLGHDPFMVLADFQSYADCQERVQQEYRNQDQWVRKAIVNVARSGRFSSDRTIAEYNRDIWHATPLTVTKPT